MTARAELKIAEGQRAVHVAITGRSSGTDFVMIDLTFDEANPPFTIGNSFNNVPAPGDSTTASAPADQPSFGSPGTTAPGADSL